MPTLFMSKLPSASSSARWKHRAGSAMDYKREMGISYPLGERAWERIPRNEISRVEPLNCSSRCDSALIFPGEIVSRLTSAATRFMSRGSECCTNDGERHPLPPAATALQRGESDGRGGWNAGAHAPYGLEVRSNYHYGRGSAQFWEGRVPRVPIFLRYPRTRGTRPSDHVVLRCHNQNCCEVRAAACLLP